MPTHNFLAYVKNIQDWRGRFAINSLHPESIVMMPILLTTDTLTLFDYIQGDSSMRNNLQRHINNSNAGTALALISLAKNRLRDQGHLASTGGNKQITRAMLYHVYQKDMLVKDISYMWNTLTQEQHHTCINEPYLVFNEQAARDAVELRERINLETAEVEAEHRTARQVAQREYEVAVHQNNRIERHRVVRNPEPLDIRIDRALADQPVINASDAISRPSYNDLRRIAEVLSVEVGALSPHDDATDAVAYHPGIAGDALNHD